MKKIPKFASKEEAALFWENHEVMDYYNEKDFSVVQPKDLHRYLPALAKPLKPSRSMVFISLDNKLLEKAQRTSKKMKADYHDVLGAWVKKGSEAQ